MIGPASFTSSYTASMYGWFEPATRSAIDFHMRSELATIVQRSSGNISTGSSDASWHQYSNSSPLADMRDSSVRSWSPEAGEQRQLLGPDAGR